MSKMDSTQNFKVLPESENRVGDILNQVYQAMTEKGYNPVNQIVGSSPTGHPTKKSAAMQRTFSFRCPVGLEPTCMNVYRGNSVGRPVQRMPGAATRRPLPSSTL